MARIRLQSLTLRLALASAAWVTAGLTLAGWLVMTLVTAQLQTAFDQRVAGLLNGVAGAVTLAPGGVPVIDSDALGDPAFARPLSGSYWQVTTAAGQRATSRSLWDAHLPAPLVDSGEQRLLRDIDGPRGEKLRLAERLVVTPETEQPLRVQVALNCEASDQQIATFRLLIVTVFAVTGIGLVAGSTAHLVWGMRPLRQAQQALAALREGRQSRLASKAAPPEIAPLLEEIDALVAQNHETVEHARAHVGNLAHALKTPLAVQRVALENGLSDLPAAREQNRAMERLVQHHLMRARAAALFGAAATEVSPLEVAQELAQAMRRLFAGKSLSIEVAGDAADRLRVDRQDLTEMLGTLVENACQWSRRRVGIVLRRQDGEMVVRITDDGPGLPAHEHRTVLARGARLDEASPGTGLGLAIAHDLVTLYGGSLEMAAATGGGLQVVLRLPVR